MTITIVDTGLGNIASIRNMLRRAGAQSTVSSDRVEIREAQKIILPGIGAFDEGMKRLHALNLVDDLRTMVEEGKTPLLGICLGAQLLFSKSEEGSVAGLGLISGTVHRFKADPTGKLRIPHMGWSTVSVSRPNPLFVGLVDPRFYFVHSYYFSPSEPADELCTCVYGVRFAAAVERRNVYGVQFHPEKSHHFGLGLLANFAAIP